MAKKDTFVLMREREREREGVNHANLVHEREREVKRLCERERELQNFVP
jgi:hypothetical protein